MKQRLVFIKGRSSKFWEVSVSKSVVTVQFGKIASRGRRTRRSCASPSAALATAKKLLRSKLAKGYKKATTVSRATTSAPGQHVVKRLINEKAKKVLELVVEGLRLTARSGRLGGGIPVAIWTKSFESNHRARQALGAEENRARIHRGYVLA